MGSFNDHIAQAKSNLLFLCNINKNANTYWDWQVTVSFYTAVHLVNAHIEQKISKHYQSHTDTTNALNPEKAKHTGAEVPVNIYLSYVKLKNLSRRSRYLCNQDKGLEDGTAQFTAAKHFYKAIKDLNLLLEYIDGEYKIGFAQVEIDCIYLDKKLLKYFSYKAIPVTIDNVAVWLIAVFLQPSIKNPLRP